MGAVNPTTDSQGKIKKNCLAFSYKGLVATPNMILACRPEWVKCRNGN